MTKEQEGIFVIQYKNYNDCKRYVTASGFPTLDIDNAKWFETRTEAYHYMLDLKLDKECIIEKID